MNNALLLLIFGIASSLMVQRSHAQHASIQGLGDLPGGSFQSAAQGVSANGDVVVGSGTTASGKHAFRWTQATGMVDIGDSSLKENWSYNVSADGAVVVGSGDPGTGWNGWKGFLWTKERGTEHPEDFRELPRYELWGVSADGMTIVGDGGQQAFRRTQGGRTISLGALPGRTSSRAVSVSADGAVAVGSSYNLPAWDHEEAFLWTAEQGMVGLGFLPGSSYSFAIAVSPDGAVVVGTSSDSSGFPAFRWSRSTGMVSLGHLPGKNTTHPFSTNANGTVIVGTSFKGREKGSAFYWDTKQGMRRLQDVLVDLYGLNLGGWELQSATGISADGRVIVGWGTNSSGNQEAFRIVLGVQ